MVTCPDMQLLYTAGLDSLMLNWLNTIGMQIFLPVAIVGLAACEFAFSPYTLSFCRHVSNFVEAMYTC